MPDPIDTNLKPHRPLATYGIPLSTTEGKVDAYTAVYLLLNAYIQDLKEGPHSTHRQDLLTKMRQKEWSHTSAAALGTIASGAFQSLGMVCKGLFEFIKRTNLANMAAAGSGLAGAATPVTGLFDKWGQDVASMDLEWVRGIQQESLTEHRKLEGEIEKLFRQLEALLQQDQANFRL